MKNLSERTVCFLIRSAGGGINEVLLTKKKTGLGKGLWVGAGGKVGDKLKENIQEAAIREVAEEIGVAPKRLLKVAELVFLFPNKPDWSQRVHAFLCEEWEGTPKESEEVYPQWFRPDNIPLGAMWDDAQYWLPEVLQGKLLRATFTYNDELKVGEKQLNVVEDL